MLALLLRPHHPADPTLPLEREEPAVAGEVAQETKVEAVLPVAEQETPALRKDSPSFTAQPADSD